MANFASRALLHEKSDTVAAVFEAGADPSTLHRFVNA